MILASSLIFWTLYLMEFATYLALLTMITWIILFIIFYWRIGEIIPQKEKVLLPYEEKILALQIRKSIEIRDLIIRLRQRFRIHDPLLPSHRIFDNFQNEFYDSDSVLISDSQLSTLFMRKIWIWTLLSHLEHPDRLSCSPLVLDIERAGILAWLRIAREEHLKNY